MRIQLRRLPWTTYILFAVVVGLLILSACSGPRSPKAHPAPADCSLTGTYGFAVAEYIQRVDWWHYNFKAAGTWREWADSTAWGVVPIPGTWSAERYGSSVSVTFEPDSVEMGRVRWAMVQDPRKACQWVDPQSIEEGEHWVFTQVDRALAAKLRRAHRELEGL